MAPADISATQCDDGGLERLLHRFAMQQSPRYGSPLNPEPDGRNVLRVLLEEVDETMLPRQLTLNCQPVGLVRVLASNRRLSGVEFVGGPQPNQSAAPSGPAELAKHHASTLSRFFAKCDEVTLLPPERVENLQSADCSCSAQLVADAADLDCFSSENKRSFASFFVELKAVSQAWLEIGSDESTSSKGGPSDLVEQLTETFRNFNKQTSPASGKTKFRTQKPECILVPITEKYTLIAGSNRDVWCLALVPAKKTEALSEHWHACRE